MGVTEQGQGDVNDKKRPPQSMRSLAGGGTMRGCGLLQHQLKRSRD